MIGYEDRFKGISFCFVRAYRRHLIEGIKGVKEVPLCSWKREVEDEAFVSIEHFKLATMMF